MKRLFLIPVLLMPTVGPLSGCAAVAVADTAAATTIYAGRTAVRGAAGATQAAARGAVGTARLAGRGARSVVGSAEAPPCDPAVYVCP